VLDNSYNMKIKNTFSNVKSFVLSHKIASVLVLVLITASPFAVSYFLPEKKSVSYVTQSVKKGNISVSVSGTGQVSSLKNVNILSKVSGEVTGVYTEAGEDVNKGDLLFKVSSVEGEKNVKQAEIDLETAQLKLEEMNSPAEELTLLQAQNALTDAEESKADSEAALAKAYEDGFNNVSNAFLDLPSVMTGLSNILFLETLSSNGSQQNIDFYAGAINSVEGEGDSYHDDAYNKYVAAKAAYEKNLADYKAASRSSDKATIESLISQTYDTARSISEAIKSVNSFVDMYRYSFSQKQMTYNSGADTHISTLNSQTGKVNSHLSSLLSSKTGIISGKDNIESADRSIRVKQLSLKDVEDGYTDLEIRTQELAVENAEQDLADAKETYGNYWIRAPFAGTISSVSSIVGDTASNGTTMGTIITKKMIATITLNEVDIAKVEIGQEADLSFDALDNVSVKGEVSEVDTVGTVSQGVVSYSVKIAFDTDNESVKPGMSITANIVTESVSDVLAIPSSAIKTMGNKSYVETMENGAIQRKEVEMGITDDTTTEIKSGLSEGEKVVVNTAKKTTTTKTTTTKSNQQSAPGMGGDMMMLTR